MAAGTDTGTGRAGETPAAGPARPRADRRYSTGRQDWSTWPRYDAAATGFRGYWYPVAFADQIGGDPTAVTVCGEKVALVREGDEVRALHDRCPHRGIPLSMGRREFPNTVSCAYHGWTFDTRDGRLAAVITDGPDSPLCGKVHVRTYPVEVRLGMVWVYVGDGEDPTPIDDQLPEEWRGNELTAGIRIDDRVGNWRFACENGFDEGHAKYLHRTSVWRTFKTMPTWNVTRIVPRGRWLYRVQDEVHWEAEFPGYGTWTNYRWWKKRPPRPDFKDFTLGNTGGSKKANPVIEEQDFPGFASVGMPGVLRIAYPKFIHYEFYVPVDADSHRYVGVMVDFGSRAAGLRFAAKYLGAVRWLFHGQFSGQDARMVEATDAPPERLYRPDVSLTEWRKLVEQSTVVGPNGTARARDDGAADAPAAAGTGRPSHVRGGS